MPDHVSALGHDIARTLDVADVASEKVLVVLAGDKANFLAVGLFGYG